MTNDCWSSLYPTIRHAPRLLVIRCSNVHVACMPTLSVRLADGTASRYITCQLLAKFTIVTTCLVCINQTFYKEGYKQFVNFTSPLREITYHMGSRSVTCYPAELTFPPLAQSKLVLYLATPKGWKAELTWVVVTASRLSARYLRKNNRQCRDWDSNPWPRVACKSDIVTITAVLVSKRTARQGHCLENRSSRMLSFSKRCLLADYDWLYMHNTIYFMAIYTGAYYIRQMNRVNCRSDLVMMTAL